MKIRFSVFDEAVSKDQYQYDDPNLYDYEYDDDTQTSADEDIKKTHRPVIITQPTHVQVPLGGIINLPCKTDFLPGMKIFMKVSRKTF